MELKTEGMGSRFSVPAKFGNYIRLHKIGEGLSSVVVLCRNTKTNELCACKCVSRKLLVESGLFLRFEQEVRILQSIHHPYILEVKDLVFDEEFIYMIIEYCPNGELFNFIVRKGRLLEDEARRLFSQLVSAVDYIHSKGISHRDLKPENILIDKNYNIKLTDFGLCHKQNPSQQLLKTQCGSPYYAPPEIVLGEKYDGFKGDIWSLGVVLFAMVTGSLPWSDLTIPALYKQIVSGIFSVPPQLSNYLRLLITSMMNVDPQQRITIEQIKRHPWMLDEQHTKTVSSSEMIRIDLNKSPTQPSQEMFQPFLENDNPRSSCKMPVRPKVIIVKPNKLKSPSIPTPPHFNLPQINQLIRKVPLPHKSRKFANV